MKLLPIIDSIKFNIIHSLTLDNFHSFLLVNKYLFIFLFIVWLGICFDHRFMLNRKILLPFYVILIILCLIIFRPNNFILTEIFWYTLILNLSFIFHVCLCDWFYRLAIYYRQEYLSFIITRISFILSLSFLIYLLDLWLGTCYNHRSNNLLKLFLKLCCILVYFLLLILIFFVNLFTNYSLILIGRSDHIKLTLNTVIKNIFFILWTFIVSYYMLGIVRIYFIWIYFSSKYIYNWIDNYFRYNRIFPSLLILIDDFETKVSSLNKNYDKINSKNFTYGFIKFLNYTKVYSLPYLRFHLRCPFHYQTRRQLITSYIKSYFIRDIINIYNDYPAPGEITEDNYDFVMTSVKEIFDLDKVELDLLKIKLRRIYKKHLNNI